MKLRITWFVKILLFYSILLTFMLPTQAIEETKSVTLAFQGPLTGSEASIGTNQLNAFRYTIKKFNSHFRGKIEVKIVEVDDQGDPAISGTVALNVASDRSIVGLVGPSYSGASIAALPFYNKYLLPLISPSASRTQITRSTTSIQPPGGAVFHRVANPVEEQGPALLKVSLYQVANPRLFVIDDQSTYSLEILESIKKYVKNVQIVGFDSIPDSTTDFSALIAKIKSSAANTVIFLGWANQSASFIRQVRDSGSEVRITISESDRSSLTKLVPSKALEGVRTTSSSLIISDFNMVLETDYRSEMKLASGEYAAETINATNVFLYCFAVGKTDRESVLKCLNDYNGKSVYGNSFSFMSTGDPLGYSIKAIEHQAGNFKPILYSESFNNFTMSDFPWKQGSEFKSSEIKVSSAEENNGVEVDSIYAKFLSGVKIGSKFRVSLISNAYNDSLEIFARKAGSPSYRFTIATNALGQARFETIRKLSGYRLVLKHDGITMDSLVVPGGG